MDLQRMNAMPDYPDIYADGFSVTAGDYGVTITLRRSQPAGEPGPHQDPSDVVARIRLAPNTAKAIAEATMQILRTVAESKGDPKTTISH
jgi:hypothetical protein